MRSCILAGESTSVSSLSFFNQNQRQSQHRPIGFWTATQNARMKMASLVEFECELRPQDCGKGLSSRVYGKMQEGTLLSLLQLGCSAYKNPTLVFSLVLYGVVHTHRHYTFCQERKGSVRVSFYCQLDTNVESPGKRELQLKNFLNQIVIWADWCVGAQPVTDGTILDR